jgi:hypothetical protein
MGEIKTNADLDTCAQVDVVSIDLVKRAKLDQAKMTCTIMQAYDGRTGITAGVWKVPLKVTDSRGTTKVFERPCVAVPRDGNLSGSPILLSQTTL